MVRRAVTGVAPLLMIVAACSGTSDESSNGTSPSVSPSPETICTEMCAKGEACGMLDGCTTYESCMEGCRIEYSRIETPHACLQALQAFDDCHWGTLSCAEVSLCERPTSCATEYEAIRDLCDVTGTGFDLDRYVLIPLICVCGVG